MTYLLIFIAGILFYGVVMPLLGTLLEYVDTKKEVFISDHSVIVAENNSIIRKFQLENEQNDISVRGFECPSMDECEEDEYEENHAKMNRKVGFCG